MITIAFSTRENNPEYISSIKKTLKIKDVEIVQIVNPGTISLSNAYQGVLDTAKNDIIVFIHDDVQLEVGWDKKILNHFKNSDYAILGKAGTLALGKNGQWWASNTRMVGSVYHKHNGKTYESKYSKNFGDKIIQTVIVDGVFIAVDRTRLVSGFDTEFEGFHFYDLPFCLNNHLGGAKIGVVFDFKLIHNSIGATNQSWEDNRLKFIEKYDAVLPALITDVPIHFDKIKASFKKQPKVSVIIPTKSNLELLFMCLDSYKNVVEYKNYEIIIADTGSTFEEKDKIKEYISTSGLNAKLVEYFYYNFSQINNDVVEHHISKDSEFIIFSNNDIQLLNDVVSEYVKIYLKNKNGLGTIGCRLYYADGTIQHAGILMISTKSGNVSLSHKGIGGYYSYPGEIEYDTFGNTGALMGTPTDTFKSVGMFPLTNECFEDVLYNMNCFLSGKVNIFTPHAVAYHFESQTRNQSEEKREREADDFNNSFIPQIQKHSNNPKLLKKIFFTQ